MYSSAKAQHDRCVFFTALSTLWQTHGSRAGVPLTCAGLGTALDFSPFDHKSAGPSPYSRTALARAGTAAGHGSAAHAGWKANSQRSALKWRRRVKSWLRRRKELACG